MLAHPTTRFSELFGAFNSTRRVTVIGASPRASPGRVCAAPSEHPTQQNGTLNFVWFLAAGRPPAALGQEQNKIPVLLGSVGGLLGAALRLALPLAPPLASLSLGLVLRPGRVRPCAAGGRLSGRAPAGAVFAPRPADGRACPPPGGSSVESTMRRASPEANHQGQGCSSLRALRIRGVRGALARALQVAG